MTGRRWTAAALSLGVVAGVFTVVIGAGAASDRIGVAVARHRAGAAATTPADDRRRAVSAQRRAVATAPTRPPDLSEAAASSPNTPTASATGSSAPPSAGTLRTPAAGAADPTWSTPAPHAYRSSAPRSVPGWTSAGAPQPSGTGWACAPRPPSTAVVDAHNHGATPDDGRDDTAALNAAIAAVPDGGTVLVPGGVYLVDATRGVRPKSSMTLRLAPDAVLRAMSDGTDPRAVVRLDSVSDVVVTGGRVEGAGFSVGGRGSARITLCGVTADRTRGRGLSVVGVDGLVVRDSVFSGTLGEPGSAGVGIALEPTAAQQVRGVELAGNHVVRNTGDGIWLGVSGPARTGSSIGDVRIADNTVADNGQGAGSDGRPVGIHVSEATDVLVTRNTVSDNRGIGIRVAPSARRTTVSGNTLSGNAGQPVVTDGSAATVSGTTASDTTPSDTTAGETTTGETTGETTGR